MSETWEGGAADVATAVRALKVEADALKKVASLLGPLTKESVHQDGSKLEKAAAAARAKLTGLKVAGLEPTEVSVFSARGIALVDSVEAAHRARLEAIRSRLGADLKAACDAACLPLRILSKEDPVRLRIAPFAVTVDRAKGKATVEFAETALAECAADAGAILAAHRAALAAMGDFDAAAFFGACLRAWQAAVATGHGGSTGRVEIPSFLPYLALELQPAKFKKQPSARTFVDYTRAQFAFDVLRLREARGLAQDGWRINLGVATGASASSNTKSKVLWIENGDGEGEYKLNVFFQRSEGGDA